MSGIFGVVGAVVGALIAFGTAWFVQRRTTQLHHEKRQHDDEQRREDIRREQETHRMNVQRETALVLVGRSNVFLDHARELEYALQRTDHRRANEVWPLYLAAWSACTEARAHVSITGPEELRDMLADLRDSFLEYGGACDDWYYQARRPTEFDDAKDAAQASYDLFRQTSEATVGERGMVT